MRANLPVATPPATATAATAVTAAASATATSTVLSVRPAAATTSVSPASTLQQVLQQIAVKIQTALLQLQQQLTAAVTTLVNNIQVALHPAPYVGTSTAGPPDPTTGTVTGTLGFTAPGGLGLTYLVSTAPTQGTVTLTAAGGFTYTPTSAARTAATLTTAPVTDSFTVTAYDGTTAATTEIVHVKVSPLYETAILGSPDPTSGAVTATFGSTDPAGQPVTYTLTGQPTNGSVTDVTAGVFLYTPTTLARVQAFYSGATTDTFTVTATDGATSTAVNVTVPISPLQDQVIAYSRVYGEDPATGAVTGSIEAFDTAGLPLTYAVLVPPLGGNTNLTSTGDFTYTPSLLTRQQAGEGELSTEYFSVQVSNGVTATQTGLLLPISPIAAIPTAPMLTGPVNTFGPGDTGAVTGTVTASDPIGHALTYQVASQPTDGTATFTSGGNFTYTPTVLARELATTGGPTTDTFTVTATNGHYTSTATTITVPITPALTTPVITFTNNRNYANSLGVVTGAVRTETYDPSLTYSLVTNPTAGTVTVSANGSFTYNGPAGIDYTQYYYEIGSQASFTVIATNGSFTTSPFTITLLY